ncbi:MAG: tRNA (adenosine(37)-N6)-threonylcarbamoyltransferase complex ATPase subunit type 1 TsaE [Bdellovibrionales bacterium]|nr:tRNA (adenosine(37)-N6)-threonylcarbamoyltransferase complex ATPase subunit type 1 TsaE [Bdellovibrionales bacterium]
MSEDIKLINSVKDLNFWISKEFINTLSNPKKDVILLNGPLGVGKTQFTSLLVDQLFNVDNLKEKNITTSSPTFSLHNIYKKNKLTVHHFDLYRLNSEKDLESFNFWDVFKEDNACIIIEWSKKFDILNFFPEWRVHNIEMSFKDETSIVREIKYT